jgi:hypothetical protein
VNVRTFVIIPFYYGSGLSISDPHHFALDADSTFHLHAHTDLAPRQSGANLQPLAYRPSIAPL